MVVYGYYKGCGLCGGEDIMADFEEQLDIEEQRAVAQESLRLAKKALLVVITPNGDMDLKYFNLSMIEQRGLIEVLRDIMKNLGAYEDEN